MEVGRLRLDKGFLRKKDGEWRINNFKLRVEDARWRSGNQDFEEYIMSHQHLMHIFQFIICRESCYFKDIVKV